jgi:large conductance mechanosensitive channel
MLKEFKEFAMKGNMVDMAVGIVMGSAFGTIIKSLVDDVMMPPLGVLMGGIDFAEMKWIIQPGDPITETAEVAISYGLFFNAVLAFLIVSLALFFVIKAINSAKKAEEEAPAAPPEPSKSEVLLEEIRDALRK